MTRASPAERRGLPQQRLRLLDLAFHGVGERQVAHHRGLIGRQLQGPLEQRHGLAVLALLGEHGAARGDDLPVRVDGIVGQLQQLLGLRDVVELEQQAAVLAGDALVGRVGGRSLLHHGERLLLLALRLEVAGEVEGGLRVLGVLRVDLAPIFGGFGELRLAVRCRCGCRRRGGAGGDLGDCRLGCGSFARPAFARPACRTGSDPSSSRPPASGSSRSRSAARCVLRRAPIAPLTPVPAIVGPPPESPR